MGKSDNSAWWPQEKSKLAICAVIFPQNSPDSENFPRAALVPLASFSRYAVLRTKYPLVLRTNCPHVLRTNCLLFLMTKYPPVLRTNYPPFLRTKYPPVLR